MSSRPRAEGVVCDLVSLGRANLDLYSQNVGADFEDSTGFDAMVGGSPTNIAIGGARLGLRSTLLSAVGTDRTGDFVLRYLGDEGVDVSRVVRIEGKLTSLALLGVKPPDDFPLSFYREDPADIHLPAEVVASFPFDRARAAQVSGTALSRGPCAGAAALALELASAAGTPTYLDLDLRPTEWATPTAFGAAVEAALPHVDVLIGTEEEFSAALTQPEDRPLSHDPVPQSERSDLESAIGRLLHRGPGAIVLKRGAEGATVMTPNGDHDIAGFEVEVVNTVGAGDAFAAGLIRSRLEGWSWADSTRFANACGAIVVTRHGCSSAMPTTAEVLAFLEDRVPA